MSATDTASMPAVPASDHAHVLEATPETLPADSRPLPDLPAGAWWPVAASIFAIAWGGNEFTPLLVMYREVSQFSDLVVDGLLGAYVLGIVPAL
ncbi:MAG: MFS transporter, partial [Dermabacter sp.]|nr:MFS transporter [Dermabacter sp.]